MVHVLTDDWLVKLEKSGFSSTNLVVGEYLMWCAGGGEKPCGVLIGSTTGCMVTAASPAYCSDCSDCSDSHE